MTAANLVNPPTTALSEILPQLEQTAAYDALKAMIAAGPAPAIGSGPVVPANVGMLREVWNAGAGNGGGEAWRARVPSFLCPSDSGGRMQQAVAPGPTNIRVSTGDWACRGGSNVESHNVSRGIFGGARGGSPTDQTFLSYLSSRVGLEAINDGTSNTIMLSERLIGSLNDPSPKIGAGNQPGVFDGTADASNLTNPRECLNVLDRGEIRTPYASNEGANTTTRGYSYATNSSGLAWGDGATFSIGFQTILPPNAPACASAAPLNGRALVPPSSNHPGGVTTVAADGSGRFVTDSVDTGDLTAAPRSGSGNSPYGIWGAYGSTNGRESRPLP